MPSILAILIIEISGDLFFEMASLNGVNTTLSLMIPAMTLCFPFIKASTASYPNRLARILSCAVGDPPLCKWPMMVTFTSYSGTSSFNLLLISKALPILFPSAAMTRPKSFFRLYAFLRSRF